ncbi:MAG: hypothetical protein Q4D81_00550 [Eubacteriales bacterium]|nr:hypothetical protein [Eubacteriales bacterium]
MAQIYYAQRKSVLNGEPQPATNKYGTVRAMERQFHLFCANACDGDEFINDLDCIEWGSLDGEVIDKKIYRKRTLEEQSEGGEE